MLRAEFTGKLLGVDGRFFNVIDVDGIIRNQKYVSERRRLDKQTHIQVSVRFDDECKNGHETFSITATLYDNRGKDVGGGCCHDDIVKAFPEFAPLIKWHLVSTDGPMHYVANVCYLAGNRDHWGRAAGEPSHFEYGVRFGDSPVTHRIKESFWKWLQTATSDDNFEWIVDKIEHKRDSTYDFEPKYTFVGYCEKWHECPFDDLADANEWLEAITTTKVEFVKIPTEFSKGKDRELDSARNVAVWPEATDAQLSLPRAELEALLLARLPKLLEEFKATMLECGFLWPTRLA